MKEYLTDEELELFIEELEQQKLYAPKHMKEQILNQAFPKQTVEVLPKSGGRERPASFLAYRIKIIAGMAAAIVMLMLLPIQGEQRGYDAELERKSQAAWMQEMDEDDNDNVRFNDIFNEGTRRVNHEINSWFNKMDNWKFNLFEDGGIYYED